jgi:hypothetical protein
MEIEMHKYEVGQTVFVHYWKNGGRQSNTADGVVTKVGRKWVTFKEGWAEDRFDMETGRIDGGHYTSPGDVYPSREAYDEKVTKHRRWEHLAMLTRGNPPKDMTRERIEAAIKILSDGD